MEDKEQISYIVSGDVSGETVFSGAQPTGNFHIGNYLGAIKNWVKLSQNNQCYFTIVDMHGLTNHMDPDVRKVNTLDAAITYLASGVNTDNANIYIQSHIKEHTELMWLLSSITPIAELERMTQFKDKKQKQEKNVNIGLLTYPVLMAADILLYNATLVPVGDDQYQHIELTRLLARKFNQLFCEEIHRKNIFVEPKIYQADVPRVMSLSEPYKKMSKSDSANSYIGMFDEPDTIRQKLAKAVSGKAEGAEGRIGNGGENLVSLLKIFAGKEIAAPYEAEYKNGTIRYADLKPLVAEHIIETLKPIREKRELLFNNLDEVEKLLQKGAEKAREVACQNMKQIRENIGLVDDCFECKFALLKKK